MPGKGKATGRSKPKKSNYGQAVSAVAKSKKGPFTASSPKPVKPPKK